MLRHQPTTLHPTTLGSSNTIADAGPIRSCIGCGERRAQSGLVRLARSASGTFVVGREAPGRGAWLCQRPGTIVDHAGRPAVNGACLDRAIQRGGFQRAFKVNMARWQVVAALDADVACLVDGSHASKPRF